MGTAPPMNRSDATDRRDEATADRVLLIEDDPDHARLVERWLQDTGRFAVSVAEDGYSGSRLLWAKPWTLVVSDIRLPGPDGLQLLRRLRMRDASTPFVLMSGRAELADGQMAIRHHASDLLTKPLHRETFVERIVALAQGHAAPSKRHRGPLPMLVDGMAHDIANRATLVSGYADLLVAELARPLARAARVREHSNTIADTVQDMVAAVNDLREIAQWSPGAMKRLDLARFVSDTLRLVEHRVGQEGASVRVRNEAAEVAVQSDPVQLRHLIVAQILAVLDARGPADGEIIVELSRRGSGAAVSVGTARGSRSLLRHAVDELALHVPVNDRSMGSPRLSVTSGRSGTFLCLTLPSGDAGPHTPPARVPSRALVIDDDAAVAGVVADILRAELGCVADEANSLEHARALLDGSPYQLVVTDLHVGPGSGLDLLRYLRWVAPELARATVVMSGDPGLASLRGEAPAVVPKPFTSEALAGACRSVLGLTERQQSRRS